MMDFSTSSPAQVRRLLMFLIGTLAVLNQNVPTVYGQGQGNVVTQPIRTYTIASILEKPYLMEKSEARSLIGNDKYEGFAKDLADNLARRLNFRYTFDLSTKRYGHQFRNGSWNGIIDKLQQQPGEGIPQLAIGAITITHARAKVVSFSTPFMEFQYALLMKKPTVDIDTDHAIGGYKDPHVVYHVGKDGDGQPDDDDDDDDDGEDIGHYIFLRPLSGFLWLVFILTILLTVVLIFVIEKIIAQKWSQAQEDVINRERPAESKVTILPKPVGLCTNGIIGSPRTTAGRFLQIIFWIYITIFIAAYIATFTADRLVDELNDGDEETAFDPKSLEPKLNTIEELVGQDDIKFAVLRGGSTYDYFLHAANAKFRKAASMMNHEGIIIKSLEEGVQRVRDYNSTFVFIMEEPTARWKASEPPCDLIVSSELFGPKQGFGVAMSQNLSPDLMRRINLEILDMKEQEELDDMEKKWFQGRNKCSNEPRKKPAAQTAPENAEDDKDMDKTDGSDADNDDKTAVDDEVDHDDDDENDDDDDEDNALCIREMAGVFYILAGALILALLVAILEIFFAAKNTVIASSSPRDENKGIELQQPPNQRQQHLRQP